MSSPENTSKKICIIRKLDFENGIVTNIRTKYRGRKKIRARITREIERIDDSCDERQSCGHSWNCSPDLTQNTREVKSPVLLKKQSRSDTSPVFLRKKKMRKREDECKILSETPIAAASPSSPVFKLKLSKHSLVGKNQKLQSTFERVTCSDFLSRENSSSCGQSSYQIDVFTQEPKSSFEISSVDSTGIKNKSSGDYSVNSKSDSSKILNLSWNADEPDPLTKWLEAKELNDSLKDIRKNYKKNSLLNRLQKLLQKQASEKLLWQHQNRKNSSSSLKFVVVDFWNDEPKFLLKCRSLAIESDIAFLVVDRKWVPSIKNVQKGSALQLHPPWQKLSIKKSMVTVFLNIICLDIADRTEETGVVKNGELRPLPINEFECDPTPFINSLFSCRFSELLI